MLDRESTFTDEDLLTLLRQRFIPVAIDQAYQRRQRDAEGEFYRRIAGQSPRNDFAQSTQGFYVATAAGELLLYNNNRNASKVTRLVTEALERFDLGTPDSPAATPIEDGELDRRWHPRPPHGGLVLRVQTRVLGGYPEPENRWDRILQSALGRDNLWLTKEEHQELVAGGLPTDAMRRLTRYHLVDNTRGEPPMWTMDQIQAMDFERTGNRITGTVRLCTEDRTRSYVASLLGFVEVEGEQVRGLDLVVEGSFFGEGRYTPGAPSGRFPLAVSFTLADGEDVADLVPPQAARGWPRGYLRAR